ncbi:MAG: type II toxin-antitoxin system PemK/MazF family toxin [Desulfobacula sp.]|jgi:mRNA interferase MazF|nr:type II toxin-antitoxin system PemK/MazF family toxin [Desulfobacula sp.]
MYKLGTIILTPFPFTDLAGTKVRPALIVSKTNPGEQDVIVCFITSKSERNQYAVKIDNTTETGLKVPSTVRLDKIATIEKKVVLGELGKVQNSFFKENSHTFFDILGFEF